ncbi:hypothetical protein COO91_10181 (plasmid) [Nostoc flagelliforme CCNUN1]|uniref:Uncharacterized protein n=1 Tax=Nostoc flagelliforme CCNUN1 TaxID=2038116 RepID=A0A2K8T8D3_9NOSO|nr:hypothetical protein COO91_10181 [Nostoc flagelliforme CCNUN1]
MRSLLSRSTTTVGGATLLPPKVKTIQNSKLSIQNYNQCWL